MESRSDKSRSANEKRGRSISALSRSYSADVSSIELLINEEYFLEPSTSVFI